MKYIGLIRLFSTWVFVIDTVCLCLVVAVAVEQHQVGEAVVVPVAVLVMDFQDVFCRET